MKNLLFSCVFTLFCQSMYSQNTIDRDSVLNQITTLLNDIGYKMKDIDRYKLYPTQNMYINLKLDTKTGKIDLIQWSLNDDKEGSMTLNSIDLSYDTGCGTFELYPTQNIYQFLLLDKVTGRTWHVQWGFEREKCWIQRIY